MEKKQTVMKTVDLTPAEEAVAKPKKSPKAAPKVDVVVSQRTPRLGPTKEQIALLNKNREAWFKKMGYGKYAKRQSAE